MSDIITERSNGILRVKLNRPDEEERDDRGMYTRMADIFNEAARRTMKYVSCSGMAREIRSPRATISRIS